MKYTRVIPALILVLTLVITGVFVIHNWDLIVNLQEVSVWTIIWILVLVVIATIENGVINYLLYRSLGAEINLIHCIGLATINTMANQLPFSGGLFVKGLFLRQRYKLPMTQYLSATAALYVCFLSTNGLIGLVSVIILLIRNGIDFPLYTVLGFLIMSMSILIFYFRLDAIGLSGRFQRILHELRDGWQIIAGNHKLLTRLILIQIISVVTMAARFWFSLKAFSQNVTMLESTLYASATILTRLLNLVPGGIGVREGIVAALAEITGFNPGLSALAVGFDRLLSTALVLVLSVLFSYSIGREVMGNDVILNGSSEQKDNGVSIKKLLNNSKD